MSKRSFRSLAVLAGAALAVGSMAPAMAARIDAGAGAAVEVDPTMIVNDVVDITGALPIPELGSLTGTAYGLGLFGLGSTFGLLTTTVLNADNIVAALDLGGVLPECGLVAVASCNSGFGSGNIALPVDVSNVDVLSGGILNNTGDLNTGNLGVGVVAPVVAAVAAPIFAPVVANVGNILDGGILNGLPLGLGSLLDLSATGEVNIVASLLGSL